MSETLSGISPEDLGSSSNESWPNSEEIISTLENGNVHTMGDVRSHYPEVISAHTNVVELANVSANTAKPVVVEKDGRELLAIYKPATGENKDITSEFNHRMYPREAAGYEVSEHFGLGLVPPTVVREVNGSVGSLQLFLEPPGYLPGRKAFEYYQPQDWDRLQNSQALRKLQVFDFLMANPERHQDNYLIKFSADRRPAYNQIDEPGIVAIDHGVSLDHRYYLYNGLLATNYGPYIFLTHDNRTDQPLSIELPNWLLDRVKNGLERREELDATLRAYDGLEQDEIAWFWRRAETLMSVKKFIGPENYRDVIPRG